MRERNTAARHFNLYFLPFKIIFSVRFGNRLKNSVKSVRPSFSIRASPSKHNGLYIVVPHPRGPGKTFPIRSQLQANDVIVIISGAIARNVGH